MNILIVSTSDIGGAGKACVRLHLGLIATKHNSKLLLSFNKNNNPSSSVHATKNVNKSVVERIKKKILRILRELKILKYRKKSKETLFIEKRGDGLDLYSFPESIYDITQSSLYQNADIINLHWVSGFLDYESFFTKNKKPVVWTLHDMNPFTGGEHYTELYQGINDAGFPIKRVLNPAEKKQFKKVLDLKRNALLNVKNIHFVTLCKWMTNELKQVEVFNQFPIHCIPNGIDSNVFDIRNKAYSRKVLNIPIDKKVILFVADLIKVNRKGFEFLLRAHKILGNLNVLLFVIGEKNKELENYNDILQYGSVDDDRFLSLIYSAADVLVVPSLMDNLPNIVIESLFCGTPVIGFPVGGIMDLIQHKKNGLLVQDISVKSLSTAIDYFFSNEKYFNREQIRGEAIKKYDVKIQASSYIQLFNNVLDSGD